MIGIRINEAQSMFFDRDLVIKATDRATRRVLSKFGAFVRQRAQTSMLGHKGKVGAKSKIRNREGTAPPGQPPFPHLGLLIRFLFFVYEPAKKAVIIGPAKINGCIGNAPEALEYGGDSQTLITRKKQRIIVSAHVKAHPFMVPALTAELPNLLGMFKDQIK